MLNPPAKLLNAAWTMQWQDEAQGRLINYGSQVSSACALVDVLRCMHGVHNLWEDKSSSAAHREHSYIHARLSSRSGLRSDINYSHQASPLTSLGRAVTILQSLIPRLLMWLGNKTNNKPAKGTVALFPANAVEGLVKLLRE